MIFGVGILFRGKRTSNTRFNRMKLRHELWKKKYPDAKEAGLSRQTLKREAEARS
jgi:hypothetical protein